MLPLSLASIATRILPVSARVRHALSAFAHGAFLSLALAMSTGCDGAAEAGDEADDDFRYVATIAAWDDVRCFTSGSTERCYAHTPDADELWMPVVSWCELQRRLDEGEYHDTSPDWNHICDNGGYPETFDDYLCFVVVAGVEECYGGSGGWYTKVEPECLTTAYSTAAWGSTTCDADKSPGVHSFDAVDIVPTGISNWARVTNGDDAFYAIPECKAPAYSAGDPYWCRPPQ